MEERHRKEGLVLLAVNLDDPLSRGKIPGFMKKYGLRCRVLLGDPGRLKGYDTSAAGTLYVVDREGLLAGVPGEFVGDLGRKAETRVGELLQGGRAAGPVLWSVVQAPRGFGLLWRRPLEGAVTALGVAPAARDHPAEIGLVSDGRLVRHAAGGGLLGDAAIQGEPFSYEWLRGADLDGDGRNEWIAGGFDGFCLMDEDGVPYWSYITPADNLRVADLVDLDGDGRREILVRDGSSIVARKAVPGNLWRTPPLGTLKSVVPDPGGVLLVQTEEGVRTLDRRGHPGEAVSPGATEGTLLGRIATEQGGALDLFGPPHGPQVLFPDDLARDGGTEILVASGRTLAVFDLKGKPVLILKFPGSVTAPLAAVGNLDGRPGDELVLAIPGEGLVALGISPEAKPVRAGSAASVAGAPSAEPSPTRSRFMLERPS